MFRLETNEFVGCCGLHPYKPREKVYEMGIHVCKEYQGKGFATEAAHAVIEYAFADLGATALFASPHPDDVVAKKLLENLGFLHMGDVYSEPTRLPHPSYLLEKVNYCSYCLR